MEWKKGDQRLWTLPVNGFLTFLVFVFPSSQWGGEGDPSQALFLLPEPSCLLESQGNSLFFCPGVSHSFSFRFHQQNYENDDVCHSPIPGCLFYPCSISAWGKIIQLHRRFEKNQQLRILVFQYRQLFWNFLGWEDSFWRCLRRDMSASC